MPDSFFIVAQVARGGSGGLMESLWGMFPFFIIIIAMFYLMSRSQAKEKKQREQMLNSIKTGDKVLTAGGIYGIVTNVKEKSFMVKIADHTKIEIARNGISSVLESKGAGEGDSAPAANAGRNGKKNNKS